MSGWTQADLNAYYDRLKRNPDAVPFGPEIVKGLPCPTLDNSEPIEIVLWGRIPAHKNEKQAALRRRKRDTAKGGAGTLYAGIITKPKAKAEMDALAVQIPGIYRDLKLRHPRIEVQFWVASEDWDRSNGFCAIEDMLVNYGVLADDSVRHFNADIHIPPAIVCDEWKTLIRLWPTS